MNKTYDLYTIFNDMCEQEIQKNINVKYIVIRAICRLFTLKLLSSTGTSGVIEKKK